MRRLVTEWIYLWLIIGQSHSFLINNQLIQKNLQLEWKNFVSLNCQNEINIDVSLLDCLPPKQYWNIPHRSCVKQSLFELDDRICYPVTTEIPMVKYSKKPVDTRYLIFEFSVSEYND